jgi:hypothetical protein
MSKWSGYVKVDFPFPVVTRFEDFCEGCTDADLMASTQKVYGDDTPVIVNNVVTCNNIDSCRRLFENFKRATNEIH